MVNQYPEVVVHDAPGYEDFKGELILSTFRASGVPVSIVREGGGDVFLIDSCYVYEVESK